MTGILVNEMEKIEITKTEKAGRHCAFCLDPIPADKVKTCGNCLRRAYCCRDCQVIDWKINGFGQGHKNWCKLDCGEEDVDWKVVPIPGKGLGVVALRPLPANYRIMVEPLQLTPTSHPRIADLMPKNGSLKEKFYYNAVGGDNIVDVDAVVCLRLSRVNHSCDANAIHSGNYCGKHKVKVLFAERDIAAGEEICFAYACFKSVGSKTTAEECRAIFKNKWGFDCPDNCICRDENVLATVKRARALDAKIVRLGRSGQYDEALKGINQLMELHSALRSSFPGKKATLMMGWELGNFQRRTKKQAEIYLKQLADLMTPLFHPDAEHPFERKLLAVQKK